MLRPRLNSSYLTASRKLPKCCVLAPPPPSGWWCGVGVVCVCVCVVVYL